MCCILSVWMMPSRPVLPRGRRTSSTHAILATLRNGKTTTSTNTVCSVYCVRSNTPKNRHNRCCSLHETVSAKGTESIPTFFEGHYKLGKPVEYYVGAAIKAGVQHQEKYGMRLLSGTMKELREFAKKGILIKKMYAVSDTPDGEKLSRDLGFIESPPAPNSTFKQYTLDLETSNSTYAREYRKVLGQYARNKRTPRSGDRKPVGSRD